MKSCWRIRWPPMMNNNVKLKIGAQIRVTVRKVWVALAEGCPYEGVLRQVFQNVLATRPTWVPARC